MNFTESTAKLYTLDHRGCRKRRISISKGLRAFVMERDGYRCQRCGFTDRRWERMDLDDPWRKRVSYGSLQIDHVIPYCDGGSSRDPDNLQVLCDPCNRKKGGMPVRFRWDGKKGVAEWLG